jgi:hypothetical protein
VPEFVKLTADKSTGVLYDLLAGPILSPKIFVTFDPVDNGLAHACNSSDFPKQNPAALDFCKNFAPYRCRIARCNALIRQEARGRWRQEWRSGVRRSW